MISQRHRTQASTSEKTKKNMDLESVKRSTQGKIRGTLSISNLFNRWDAGMWFDCPIIRD